MAQLARFQPKEIEYTCRSGRTFKLRELNGQEQINADSLAKNDNTGEIIAMRIAMALASVDGETLPSATSDLVISSRLESLSGSELTELSNEYIFRFVVRSDDLPNESAPAAE